jgi:transposase
MLSFPPSSLVRVFIGREPIDMRKGIDGLVGLVINRVQEDPQSGHLFVFFNRGRNRMKALIWDRSGYWMLVKRLEHGRYQVFDRVSAARGTFEVSSTELALLLDGIDLRGARRRPSIEEIKKFACSL